MIPIRLGLGVALFGAARVAGAATGPALLAFVVGVFGITFVLLAGVEAGLGVAAVLSLRRVDPHLYVDPSSHVVYRR